MRRLDGWVHGKGCRRNSPTLTRLGCPGSTPRACPTAVVAYDMPSTALSPGSDPPIFLRKKKRTNTIRVTSEKSGFNCPSIRLATIAGSSIYSTRRTKSQCRFKCCTYLPFSLSLCCLPMFLLYLCLSAYRSRPKW